MSILRTSGNIFCKKTTTPISSVKQLILVRNYAVKKAKVKKIDDSVQITDALKVIRAYEIGKDNDTFEIHIQCKPEKGQHQIRGNFIMPHALNNDIKLLVFAEGKQAAEAKEAGADIVGCMDIIEKIKNEELEFDKCISTTGALPHVAKIARILGPKGLMPTVNKGNVTDDITNAVKYAKKSFEFKEDKFHIVHAGFAKLHFSDEQVIDNATELIKSVRAHARPGKKKFLSTIHLSSTWGPGIKITPP